MTDAEQPAPHQTAKSPSPPRPPQQVSLNSEDEDRKNRFQASTPAATVENGTLHNHRAASQPPRSSADPHPFFSSPSQQYHVPSSLTPTTPSTTSPWINSRLSNAASARATTASGLPLPVPIRSSSFSTHQSHQFSTAMRDRVFPSTFEDDESEGLSDAYDTMSPTTQSATANPPAGTPTSSVFTRGRTYAQDLTRSRSQSLAAATSSSRPGLGPGSIGSPYFSTTSTTPTMQSFNDSFLSNALNTPHRYGDIKPPGASRYGSLGTLGRSPISSLNPSSPGGAGGAGFADGYNMSPFVRDVGQILLDEGSLSRDLWAGMNPPRDETVAAGGASGTASRRHSVSVVQPRRNTLQGGAGAGVGGAGGIGIPGAAGIGSSALLDGSDDFVGSASTARSGFGGRLGSGVFGSSAFGSGGLSGAGGNGHAGLGSLGGGGGSGGLGGLRISEDDLVADFSTIKLSSNGHGLRGAGGAESAYPPSQPSSLPIYAPLSRSPPPLSGLMTSASKDLMTPFGSINLSNISTAYAAASRQRGESPIDTGAAASPTTRSVFDSPVIGGAGSENGRFGVSGQPYLPQRTGSGSATATAGQKDVLGQNGSAAFTRARAPSAAGAGAGGLPSPISPSANVQPGLGGRIGGVYHHPYYPPGMQRAAATEVVHAQAQAYAQAQAQAQVQAYTQGAGVGRDSPANGTGEASSPGIGQEYGLSASTSPTTSSLLSPTSLASPPGLVHQAHHLQQQQQAAQQQAQQSQLPHPALSDLGKGLPLHAVPPSWPLYIVEFKAGRTDIFYSVDPGMEIKVGDLVIVEADRGKDLGKVVNDGVSVREVEAWVRMQQQQQAQQMGLPGGVGTGAGAVGGGAGVGSPGAGAGATGGVPGMNVVGLGGPLSPGAGKKEISPKMIYGKAQQQDAQLLVAKMQDEMKALQLCQTKVKAKKLPMEVVDAEYQWDRRKLTFYFVAEKRIDFRELVRELFRLYKTRIWMASLQGGVAYEQ
ncbi:hypothetical protein AX16_009356 [Volvariella volvacea WC 439]|nr:hypothetical protein AX16_009356 [Volvariella volvacea WC 439]